MVDDRFVWLAWASAFLVPWVALFIAFPRHRQVIWWASICTAPFGLTEPLFVPEYWNPPSLFDLAQRTGFDIESIIFCFAIGGVGAALYNVVTGRDLVPINLAERRHPRHRYHIAALLSPVVVFLPIYFAPWNPIYPAVMAMAFGALATMTCRADLMSKTWIGGLLFLGYYALFMFGLKLSVPGYIERVWKLDDISGVLIYGVPVEELIFAIAFGMYWAGVYEHITWRRPAGQADLEGVRQKIEQFKTARLDHFA
jgi:hypothetical protein